MSSETIKHHVYAYVNAFELHINHRHCELVKMCRHVKDSDCNNGESESTPLIRMYANTTEALCMCTLVAAYMEAIYIVRPYTCHR